MTKEKVVLEGNGWGFHPPVEMSKEALNDVWSKWLHDHGLLTPEQADTIRYAMSKAVVDQERYTSRIKHTKRKEVR